MYSVHRAVNITLSLTSHLFGAEKLNRKDFVKWLIFTFGLAVAVGSCISSFVFLYTSLYDKATLVYEPNDALAIFEIGLIVLAFAVCFVASEMCWKYLTLKSIVHKERT